MNDSDSDFQSEIQRIKKEYKRRAKEIPGQRYSNSAYGNAFIHQRREDEVLKTLSFRQLIPFGPKKILDLGCGLGAWMALFKKWGAKEALMAGADLDEDKVCELKKRMPDASICCCEASALPWRDESFDMILQSTLFTSITSSPFKRRIAEEMMRVLKEKGVILWYDFRYDNPWNSQVKGIQGEEIRDLFKGCTVFLRSVTLLPPLARILSPFSTSLALAFEKIPFLRSHYVAVIEKKINLSR